MATDPSSQQASVQQQHARHASRKFSEDKTGCPQLHPRRVQHIIRSYFIQRSRKSRTWHCQRKRGENPRCHLQPYLIQRPPSNLLQSTVAHNNCLHTSGSLQATRVRASRHSQQTFTETSYNQTQCTSAATETCHGPSRRRYSSNHNVGAVFQYNNTQTTQSVPSLIRSIVRRLRIIRPGAWHGQCPTAP